MVRKEEVAEALSEAGTSAEEVDRKLTAVARDVVSAGALQVLPGSPTLPQQENAYDALWRDV